MVSKQERRGHEQKRRRYVRKLKKDPIPWKIPEKSAEMQEVEVLQLKKDAENYLVFVENCVSAVGDAMTRGANPREETFLGGEYVGADGMRRSGSCMDFILDSGLTGNSVTDRMAMKYLYNTDATRYRISAPACTDNGNQVQCIGKLFSHLDDYTDAYGDDEKGSARAKSARNTLIASISQYPDVDVVSPLCTRKTASGSERIACIERTIVTKMVPFRSEKKQIDREVVSIDPTEMGTIIERRMGTGNSVVPILRAQCTTIDDKKTTCLDMIIDNMTVIGTDDKFEKYYQKDHEKYLEIFNKLAYYPDLSGLANLMKETTFLQMDRSLPRTNAYDKIILQLADVGPWRGHVAPMLKTMADRSIIDYSFIGENPSGCVHPFTRAPTTCLDAGVSIMYDRRPGSSTCERYPRSSAARYKNVYELVVKGAVIASPVEARDDCTAFPTGRSTWKNTRT